MPTEDKEHLLISKEQLRATLAEHESDIGHKAGNGILTVLSGLAAIIPAIFSGYYKYGIWGIVGMIVLITLGGTAAIMGMKEIWSSIKHPFDSNKLGEEIISMSTHPFSIVAIKDTFQQFPNRFLLYYDTRWQCDFFLNYRTQTDERKNTEFIKKRLSEQLKVDVKSIQLDYKTEDIYTKYSVSDKCNKSYDHRIYQATIGKFPEIMKSDRFMIDGVSYHWATTQEMNNDPDIKAKNSEMVKLIEEYIS